MASDEANGSVTCDKPCYGRVLGISCSILKHGYSVWQRDSPNLAQSLVFVTSSSPRVHSVQHSQCAAPASFLCGLHSDLMTEPDPQTNQPSLFGIPIPFSNPTPTRVALAEAGDEAVPGVADSNLVSEGGNLPVPPSPLTQHIHAWRGAYTMRCEFEFGTEGTIFRLKFR